MSAVQISRKRKATTDRINNLPQNVTQQILECLPLREAARTSILSSNWKHQWTSITKLVLDESFLKSILKKRMETTDISLAYSKAVNDILLSHVGPIREFVLYISSWFLKETDISLWIRYVRANGVKNFTLEDDRGPEKYLPTSFFSCKDLTHLTLIKCKFLPLPPNFQGFPSLITLRWKTLCFFSGPCIEISVLETLISKCPQLQSLCLHVYAWSYSLSIRAPNLQELFVEGLLSNLSLEGTTSISKLALDLYLYNLQSQRKWHMRDFFSALQKVQKLTLKYNFWMAMQLGKFRPPRNFPNELERLQTLKVVDIPLHCRFSISLLLCLLGSSPRLERLYIKATEREKVSDEQSTQIDENCILPCLQNVQLLGISGLRSELQLIKILLACSPALEEMNIELSMEMGGAQEKFNFFTESLRYRPASPNAEINIKTKKVLSVDYSFSPIWLDEDKSYPWK